MEELQSPADVLCVLHNFLFQKSADTNVSVSPSFQIKQLGPHWGDFHEFSSIFRNSAETIQVALISDKNNSYFTWIPVLYMNTGTLHEYRYFTWIPVLYMNTGTLHEYRYFIWIPVLYMNTGTLHEYRYFTWIPVLYMNTGNLHEYRYFTWIPVIYMNTGNLHEYRYFTWIPVLYMNTGTLHEYRYTFMVTSLLIVLRMKNFSDKICRENNDIYSIFNTFVSKILAFVR